MNFALVISKLKYGDDIRKYGSGNAGMTNMMRTYGKAAAGLTLLGDALKAVVSAVIGYISLGEYGAYIAGLFCILGHMFPIYYKFKGGKGVVTVAISILMCDPLVFLILFILFILFFLSSSVPGRRKGPPRRAFLRTGSTEIQKPPLRAAFFNDIASRQR
jgi:glycerol-3-phosphate acyltransferase PlsY